MLAHVAEVTTDTKVHVASSLEIKSSRLSQQDVQLLQDVSWQPGRS